MIHIIRLTLSAVLLFQVFRNAHWSVGLSLTMLTIGNEVEVWAIRKIRKILENRKILESIR